MKQQIYIALEKLYSLKKKDIGIDNIKESNYIQV